MADLNVQPKRKRSTMLLVLLLLAIATLAYFLLNRNGRESTDQRRVMPAATP